MFSITNFCIQIIMSAIITTRIPNELEEQLEGISRMEHLDKSTVVRRLLGKAVEEWMIDHALSQYRDGKITLGKAAKDVGLPLREMIAIAAKKGIPFQYGLDDLMEDFQSADNL